MKKLFTYFYLDKEKDLIVKLFKQSDLLSYEISTPNHHSGNLITNLARLCKLKVSEDSLGLKIIEGQLNAYINYYNQKVYVFNLAQIKVAEIYEDGSVKLESFIPAISKILMSQCKNYDLPLSKTIIKSYIPSALKFKTDLHTHMNANLHPDLLIALGIVYQIRYPLYYIKKLGLLCSDEQEKQLARQREEVKKIYQDSKLEGKYLERQIDDHTYINFASLILDNLENAVYNLPKIRNSLAILKDGQTSFTNLEKVYFYRYVFAKGSESNDLIKLHDLNKIPDSDITKYVSLMLKDLRGKYHNFTLRELKLLWVARQYQQWGIEYVEISDTSLVKKEESAAYLKSLHKCLPLIEKETHVRIRFLAALRRIPLNLGEDPNNYQNKQNEYLKVLYCVASDPYISGCDIVGEEINDIRELQDLIKELVKIASENIDFTIRIHAGENDCLSDNILNSILCVKESLNPKQEFPRMRIGHGLHCGKLNSKKGNELKQLLKENKITLEFQISSNVRLNNLTSLKGHPLKAYLSEGIFCIQGSDGGTIYGSNSYDEQLALQNLLSLSNEELQQMVAAEKEIIEAAAKEFNKKFRNLNKEAKGKDLEIYYNNLIVNDRHQFYSKDNQNKLNSKDLFKSDVIKKIPIVILGGSFNNERHRSTLKKADLELLDRLLKELDKDKYCFVIGPSLKAYENYLVQQNQDFDIYALIPSQIEIKTYHKLKENDLKIIISPESSLGGLYKSFNYEIFKRRKAFLIAFDVNSAGLYIIQEAKNGWRFKSRIYLSAHSRLLRQKASSLEGYVTLFDKADVVIEDIGKES